MLKLMYITNNPDVAGIAEAAGVDRIFVDLERLYKQERQKGMDTVQSFHTLEDVSTIRNTLSAAELLVRSNPVHPDLRKEIDTIITNGADIVMLPYFKTAGEAARFIDYVDKRVKTCLLIETAEAVDNIDDILSLDGIDELYIGLNDLHLAYRKKFMFELLTDGTVEMLAGKIRKKGIPYGFGGIARLGTGTLPAEQIIKEHYRLNSTRVILSRSFCNTNSVKDDGELKELFSTGINDIRQLEKEIAEGGDCLAKNQEQLKKAVAEIIK